MPQEQPIPRPTDAELAILRVLWERGASTVREVQESLSSANAVGYTTVLKLMQIMTEKGLVERDESQRAHVYTARFSEQKTQKRLLNDLVERAFNGSASKLVMQALADAPASATELAELRRLIEDMERKR